MHSARPSRGQAAWCKTVLAVLLGGVCGAEIGYYDSLDDRSGTNPALENSQFRFLVTYQRQLAQDFTGSLEYYGEWMQDFAAYRRSVPAGFPARPELRDLIGLRLTQLWRYQTLKLSLYSGADRFHDRMVAAAQHEGLTTGLDQLRSPTSTVVIICQDMKEISREILLGFWKVHILHHAGVEPLHGQWMLNELRHHGYEISPGTLYPLLRRMERLGWLKSRTDPRGGKRARKDYRLTAEGVKVLALVREQVRELYDEVVGSVGTNPRIESK